MYIGLFIAKISFGQHMFQEEPCAVKISMAVESSEEEENETKAKKKNISAWNSKVKTKFVGKHFGVQLYTFPSISEEAINNSILKSDGS